MQDIGGHESHVVGEVMVTDEGLRPVMKTTSEHSQITQKLITALMAGDFFPTFQDEQIQAVEDYCSGQEMGVIEVWLADVMHVVDVNKKVNLEELPIEALQDPMYSNAEHETDNLVRGIKKIVKLNQLKKKAASAGPSSQQQ